MADLTIAFDTATPGTIVAVRDGDAGSVRAHHPAAGERPGHTAELLTLLEAALRDVGRSMADVGRIGVGVGPGSFTGLRIGVATGRALALTTGADVVPVSSLDALAHGAGAGDGAPVLAVIDARRREVFVAAWAGGRRTHGPAAIAPDQVAAVAAAHAPGAPAFGDGAVRYRAVLEGSGLQVAADADPRHRVDGTALTDLTGTGTPVAREDLVPDYVRRPDVDDR